MFDKITSVHQDLTRQIIFTDAKVIFIPCPFRRNKTHKYSTNKVVNTLIFTQFSNKRDV